MMIHHQLLPLNQLQMPQLLPQLLPHIRIPPKMLLELHRSFHGIPSGEKCAAPKAALPLNNSAATGKQYLRTK